MPATYQPWSRLANVSSVDTSDVRCHQRGTATLGPSQGVLHQLSQGSQALRQGPRSCPTYIQIPGLELHRTQEKREALTLRESPLQRRAIPDPLQTAKPQQHHSQSTSFPDDCFQFPAPPRKSEIRR